MHIKFWSENVRGKGHSEDLGANRKNILVWILWKYGWDGVDWMHLAQEGFQWQVNVNISMKFWVH